MEVAGFVLRDPFDSPGLIPAPLYGEVNFDFGTFSPRPRTFIVEDGWLGYYVIAVLTRVTYYRKF